MSSERNVLDINSAHWADHWLHNELRIKNRIIPARCSCLTCQWEKGGKNPSLRAESGSSEDPRVGSSRIPDGLGVGGGPLPQVVCDPQGSADETHVARGEGSFLKADVHQLRCRVFFGLRRFLTRLHLPDSRSVTEGEAASPPVLLEQILT